MHCASCMTAMVRQPLGSWHKACSCLTNAYVTAHAPLPRDAKIFHDLTGRRDFTGPSRLIYRYGPPAIPC